MNKMENKSKLTEKIEQTKKLSDEEIRLINLNNSEYLSTMFHEQPVYRTLRSIENYIFQHMNFYFVLFPEAKDFISNEVNNLYSLIENRKLTEKDYEFLMGTYSGNIVEGLVDKFKEKFKIKKSA